MSRTIIELMDDMHLSNKDLFKQYYDAMVNNNVSQAELILSNNPELLNQIMNAENINYLINAINERELQPKTEIDYFLENLLNEFQRLIDNTRVIGSFDSSIKYYAHNCVNYQGNTYFCIGDDTPIGTLPTDTNYWLGYNVKGLNGYGGVLNMSYKGSWNATTQYEVYDLVVFQNKIWWAIAPNMDYEPNLSHYPWILVGFPNISKKTPIQIEEPSGYSVGDLWFKIISGTDITQDEWEEITGETYPRYACGSFIINDMVYIVGGENAAFMPSNNNEAFDMLTETWSIKADYPEYLHGISGFTLNNIGYCVGGVDSYLQYQDCVYSYNPQSNTWTQKNDFPIAIDSVNGAIVNNNRAYMIGVGTMYGYTSNIYIYDADNDIWEIDSTMPLACMGCGLGTYNNKIYICGGSGLSLATYDTLYIYDTTTKTFSEGSSLPQGRSLAGILQHNDKIYLVGGIDQFSYSTNSVEVYDITNNTWNAYEPINHARISVTSAYNNTNGYIFGGLDVLKPEILSSAEKCTFGV